MNNEHKGFPPEARDWFKPGEQVSRELPSGYAELEGCQCSHTTPAESTMYI